MEKRLESPSFLIRTGSFEITDGIQAECFSSRSGRADWCRVAFASALYGQISYADMEPAEVMLGYEDDYDVLLTGFCRERSDTRPDELLIRDAMIRLEQLNIRASFVSCTPQDIIRYVLSQAGVTDYRLSDQEYGVKAALAVSSQNGVQVIEQVNRAFGCDNDFFFRDGVFYWGLQPRQDEMYVLEEDQNILSLQKYGSLFEIETFGIPWIHHSQMIEVVHAKYSGVVRVEKTIIRSDEKGNTRMYLYFGG